MPMLVMLDLLLPADRPSGCSGGEPFYASVPPRVAVFIDWQNAYRAGRRAFELDDQGNERGNFSPLQLGRILDRGQQSGQGGSAGPGGDSSGAAEPCQGPDRSWGESAAGRRLGQGGRVVGDPAAPVIALSVSGRADQAPVEKGIDVQLALAVAETALTETADVAILFTHDTDLTPAIEMVARLKGPRRIETAGWASGNYVQRLRQVRGVHHHAISGTVFEIVETPVNYAYPKT